MDCIRVSLLGATQEHDPRSGGLHLSELEHAAQTSDFWSDGLHSSKIRQLAQKCDHRSERPLLGKVSQTFQEPQNNFPRLITTSSNQNNSCQEDSVDSNQSDDEGYDKNIG